MQREFSLEGEPDGNEVIDVFGFKIRKKRIKDIDKKVLEEFLNDILSCGC